MKTHSLLWLLYDVQKITNRKNVMTYVTLETFFHNFKLKFLKVSIAFHLLNRYSYNDLFHLSVTNNIKSLKSV